MMHAHYGNGADDTIDRLNDAGIRHHTMGKHFQEKADVGRNGTTFLAWLDRAIDDCRDVELVIYQAGADPHVKDPLGGMLTTAPCTNATSRSSKPSGDGPWHGTWRVGINAMRMAG